MSRDAPEPCPSRTPGRPARGGAGARIRRRGGAARMPPLRSRGRRFPARRRRPCRSRRCTRRRASGPARPTRPPPPSSSPRSPPAGPASSCGRSPAATCSRPAWPAPASPPDRILYAECGRDEDVLAVMEEGLRHGGLAAVVGEVRPGRHARHPPAPARRRGGRNARPDAPALARERRGSARPAVRRRHPLAPRLRPVLAPAGGRDRPPPLAPHPRPPARRSAVRPHHGEPRCRGSPRSTFRI